MKELLTQSSLEKEALILLDRCVDMSELEQVKFINQSCGNNKKVLKECLQLLNHEIQDDDFHDLIYKNSHKNESSCDLTGQSLGNYILEKKIGSGGTADVYLAYRNDNVHSEPVALKILRGWGNTNELIERMKQERKILSQFKHPNIANFIDGGNSADGRPYFVLEYIKGETIIDYCRENKLSINKRLQLFIAICSAVYAAHSKLILHRDLKPSNIIVTQDGVPKLLDFGIAKILDQEGDCNLQLTKYYSPMTPQYASPEQINQEPLSVASDQYSLGILLYELLTEKLPFSKDDFVPGKIIDFDKIKNPSCHIKLREKNIKNKKLFKKIRGDIDAIVMKSINSDPVERYDSVKALSDDLKRYLKNKTIFAKKPSVFDVLKKFFKRNKNLVLVSAFLLSLTVFLTTAQQLKILEERDQALIEREKFEKTQEFLLSLFKISHPENNHKKEITVREFLDRGVDKIWQGFTEQPLVKISLLSTMAKAYKDLGINNTSMNLQQMSLELQKQHGNSEKEMLAITYTELADLLIIRAENDKAQEYINKAINIIDSLNTSKPKNRIHVYSIAGLVANRLGEYENAITHLDNALSIQKMHFPDDFSELARRYMLLGVVYTGKGDYLKAQDYNNMALSLKLKNPERDPVTMGALYNTMAVVYHYQEEYSQAVRFYEKSINIRTALFGKDNLNLVISYNNLGEAYTAQGLYDEAIMYHTKSFNILKNNDNNDGYYLAVTHNRAGDAYIGIADFDKAYKHLMESLRIRKKAYGPEHRDLAKTYDSLGDLYLAMKEEYLAKSFYEKSLSIKSKVYGEKHQLTQSTFKKIESLFENHQLTSLQ